MSSEKTKNLQMHKWGENDSLMRSEWNENFQKLDDEAKEVLDATKDTVGVTHPNLSTRLTSDYTKLSNTFTANKVNWLSPVATYALIATTYPTPLTGDTVQVENDTSNNGTYRFDGSIWVKIQNPNGYAHTSDIALKEMFPDETVIDLEGRTIGNIVLTRTKVKLGTITLG